MKYLVFIVFSCIVLISCGKSQQVDSTEISSSVNKYETYVFKVDGLNDSLLSDTLTKMIFVVEGIEQMSIQKTDSIVVIVVDGRKVTNEELSLEISNRGGIILN